MKDKSTEKKAGIAGDRKSAVLHLNRYRDSADAHTVFMENERLCTDFVFGDQWDEDSRKRCKADMKPTLTINLTLRTINAIYGEYASMKADIAVKPRSDKAEDTTEILNKIIKQVMYDNKYGAEEAQVFLDGITSGRGFFNVRLDNSRDPLGEISIISDDNLQVVMSKDAKSYDPDDWPEVFYVEWKSREDIEAEFGADKVDLLDYSAEAIGQDVDTTYMKYGHTIGGTDHQNPSYGEGELEFEEAQIITREFKAYRDAYVFVDPVTTDTETVPKDELDEEKPEGMTLKEYVEKLAKDNRLEVYEIRREFIKRAIFCGEVLIDEYWSPYDYYECVPFFAYFSRGRTMGVVENLISPQEQLNKAESQELHIINSTTNGGWTVEENSLVNMSEETLAEQGSKTGLVVVHRRGTNAPIKIQPNGVPTGISNMGGKAANNIMSVSGVNDGMLGFTGQNVAGKTVGEKKQSGQAQLQRIFDNLEFTRTLVGRAILSIVQNMFTEPRVLRFTADSEENTTEQVAYNQVTAAGEIVNDVSIGKYDMVVTTRPKQDTTDDYDFTEALQMREIGVAIPDWVLVEKSHMANKDEIVHQMKRAAGMEMSPQEQEIAQLTQQMKIADMQLSLREKQAKIAELDSKAQLNMANAQDVAQGQNQRLIMQLMADDKAETEGNDLRRELAEMSADTKLVSSNASDRTKQTLQQEQLGAMFDMKLLDKALDGSGQETETEQTTDTPPQLGVTNENQSGI